MGVSPLSFNNVERRIVRPRGSPLDITARLALDDQTRADAFAIRHASYLAGGYIDPQPHGLFTDSDDLKPGSHSIVIYKDKRPVASVRICLADLDPALSGWDEIPASRIFPEAVAALGQNVAAGRPARLLEINRLVRHPDFSTDYQLVVVLFSFVGFMQGETDCDLMLSCVRQNHSTFYKRMDFGYIAGPRRYAGVKFETNLMACLNKSYGVAAKTTAFFGPQSGPIVDYAGFMAGDSVKVFTDVLPTARRIMTETRTILQDQVPAVRAAG
ncbi:MAG: hypothetical protein POH28_06820 [Acidocella sp.]|nr:hypothetical protein [Acidocella sp.]